MIPINPREPRGNVPVVEGVRLQGGLQSVHNMPISYVMHALSAYKGGAGLKEISPVPPFPASTMLSQVSQPQVRSELVPCSTLSVATAPIPVPPPTGSVLMCLRDQPVSIYTIPVSSNGGVQRLLLSVAAPGNPEFPCRELPFIPVEIDSQQIHLKPLPGPQKRLFGAPDTYKSTRLKWSAEMSRDLENVYDGLVAARMRPTQRVVHEIMREKYPFMTELHVQSKLQKLRQTKRAIRLPKETSW